MKENKIKASFKSRAFKGGIFTTVLALAAIVVIVIVNIIANKIGYTADLSDNGIFSIGEETETLAKEITDTIRIYYFATTGEENEYCYKVAKLYDGLGSDMKFIEIDPVLHPNYAASLLNDGTTQVDADTVIVVDETTGRTKTILSSEMYVSEISGIDYTTYSYTYTYSSAAESKIDAALLYVTAEKVPAVYYTTSHGELDMSDTLTELIEDNNMTLEEIDLLTSSEIPEDCDVLFINNPAYDFTAEETALVKDYLANGGKAIISVSYLNASHTNLLDLLSYYGLELAEGLVVEGDSRYYVSGQYPYYLLPTISAHDITDGVKAKKRVLVPVDGAMTISSDLRSTLTVDSLLTTSDSSFSKIDSTTSYNEFVDGVDISGPFVLAACATDETDTGTAELIVYSSYYIWDDSLLTQSSYGNSTLLINSFKYLADIETEATVSSKEISDYTYLDINESAAQANVIIKLIVLPFGCLAAGIIIVIARRRSR